MKSPSMEFKGSAYSTMCIVLAYISCCKPLILFKGYLGNN